MSAAIGNGSVWWREAPDEPGSRGRSRHLRSKLTHYPSYRLRHRRCERVSAARRAAAERERIERLRAANVAWRANAGRDAALRPSRRNAFKVARERRGDGRTPRRPAR